MIVERIEDDIAVIEIENAYIELPLDVLPDDVSEGDVLSIVIDRESTRNKREEVRDKLTELFSRDS